MNFKIVQLTQFSGYHAGRYSIFLENEQQTLFDRFIKENSISFKNEIIDISNTTKADLAMVFAHSLTYQTAI